MERPAEQKPASAAYNNKLSSPSLSQQLLQQQQQQQQQLQQCVLVHFDVGNRREVALFRTDTPDDQLKDLFRSAAEAGPRDILKLYSSTGMLMNISSSLPANTPTTAYTLQVVAAHTHDASLATMGADTVPELRALEERVAELERQLRADHEQLPPAVQELRAQVDAFRHKLETTEALSWLGFYKQLPEPLSTDECRRLQYRRKSDSIRKRVKENFFNICDSTLTEEVQQWLRTPTFDSIQWEDEELILLLQQMFMDLDLCTKFNIDMKTLRNFLYEVYKNYNEVPFHNFRHCFCVSQMMYAIACYVDLPSKIGDLETLILLTSSICHDLDHPGYNNIYQINAKTELALRYNDISPLENHHCSVAFRILENDDCNIFKTFSNEMFKQVREGMIRCILATDMARHNEILAQFKEITPIFDYTNKVHVNSLCMVLIKVADISNEARPMDVAEPWLDRLLQEFFKQSDAEKLEGLPVTPFMDRDKITKPSSQCSFIGFVLLPLFEALGELFTELQDLIVQPVRFALEYYRRLNEATKEERMHRKSVVAELLDHQSLPSSQSPDSQNSNTVPKSGSNHSVRSKKSISFAQNRSRSRSTDEDLEHSNADNPTSDEEPCSLAEVAEDNEDSGDSETATEVEVSEKTLKFKISTTDGLASGRKSYPGSRKGSREKVQQLNCIEVARAVQGEKDRRRMLGAHSFDQRALMGKKLSFDTSELMADEHARRYLKQMCCRRISHDEYGFRQQANEDGNESPLLLEKLRTKRNSTAALVGIRRTLGDGGNSRPGEKNENNKQVTLSDRTMEVALNSRPGENCDQGSSADETADSSAATAECRKPLTNSCKYDKISFEAKSDSETRDDVDSGPGEKDRGDHPVVASPGSKDTKDKEKDGLTSPNNGNRSILSRLKQFTDRFGLSIDKDTSKFRGMLSLKNNNGTRMTLPLRYRGGKKEENAPCCETHVFTEEDKRASTLPKASKAGGGTGKKSWRQRLTLARDRAANSLDSLPPSSPMKTAPVAMAATASTSHSSSATNIPATCDRDREPDCEDEVKLEEPAEGQGPGQGQGQGQGQAQDKAIELM